MDVNEVLLHILVVLLTAKLAAEAAERLSIPPVLGEIVAGIIIGPSVLGLVGNDDVLRVLGELGVILLLLQVGLEMDLGELGSVGRASLTVASIGVVVPLVAGYGTGLLFGMDASEALFVGAALTATSVGITARVFGDLRALASVEARTVLGAAVADDVMGLVILTVVTRIVSEGSVSLVSLAWIVVVAVGFLVVATGVGVRVAPPVFAAISRHSRSSGTLVAAALAFTLAIAELANAAQLAPIVGAFVAGIVLGRCAAADRIRRDITPVGHLLIPVFFLQIGIDVDVSEFAHPEVLGLAAVLVLVAIAGKLVSAAGLWRAPGDRLLVGIGMIPRGEVGLIFATLGLRQGVFGEDVYAALLLVVLITTVATPPALKQRLERLRAQRQPRVRGAPIQPATGWFEEVDDRIELVAEPSPGMTLEVGLEAARRCAVAAPGESLLTWLNELPAGPLRWNRAARDRFMELLDAGSERSWRLLTIAGVLERALPELGAAVERRQAAAEFDPLSALHWSTLARLRTTPGARLLPDRERLLLAALILDATEQDAGPAVLVARKTCQRLDVGAAFEQAVVALVADAGLLPAAMRRLDGLDEESILQLAAHIASAERARALALLTEARTPLTNEDQARLDALARLLDEVLRHPELTGRQATNTVEQRRAQAERLVGNDLDARERIHHAPRAYLLRIAPADAARQVRLCDPVPPPNAVRVGVAATNGSSGPWWVEVATRDRPGLLARETAVLTGQRIDIDDALAVTWGDGCALASFLVHAQASPDADGLQRLMNEALRRPLSSPALEEATVEFDDAASPWHTVCTARASDRLGLLQALTTAFAAADTNVHAARVLRSGTTVVGIFELTDSKSRKLGSATQEAIRSFLSAGVMERPSRWPFISRRSLRARPVAAPAS